MSPKSRRSQKRSAAEEPRPRPRLHAHHRIRSDSVGHEPPLTIDQHLSNYHRSLHASASSSAQYHPPSRYKFREPLGVMVQNKRSTSASSIHQLVTPTSHSSTPETDPMSPPASTDLQPSAPLSPSFSSPCPADIFFQHRPLTYSSTAQRPSTTLLCPSTTLPTPMATSQLSIGSPVSDPLSSTTITTTTASSETTSEDAGRDKEKEGSGLLQLAHVVSTFG
ncbi:uncharacterized protein BYT42DRAFT_542646 [Radiomyces spectabilis]|uniref:uncharacterized protein n=1 Tax=Radiomyces spectabilis TaxID=64574 RepID=UPI002220855C|nr:uncharacterized protein BYT42DRAFT_542646 [Radiomyces spectabilis]KAI8391017.1 hypothetical protein BYT42DRAFT_542646 [Radiomyces spectabilis]